MKQLKEARKKLGLTLRQVEEATGISNAYLSQLETGKIKNRSMTIVYKLSQIYAINIEDLLIAFGKIKEIDRVMPRKHKYTDEQFEQLLIVAHEANNHARHLVINYKPDDRDEHVKVDNRAQFLSQFADNKTKIVQS